MKKEGERTPKKRVLSGLWTVLAWILAMVAATLLLFAIDVVLRHLLGGSPNLWVGLGFALIVYALLFIGASRLLDRPHGWIAAALTSLGFIVGLPALVTFLNHSDGPEIRSQAQIPGRIDLVVVSPNGRHERVPRPADLPPDLAAWDLRYTVAVPAQGGKGLEILVAGTDSRAIALRALRTGRALEPGGRQVQWRPGAQRAVVLDVDRAPVAVAGSGTGPALDRSSKAVTVNRSPLVAAVASLPAPVFAALGGSKGQRLDEWSSWTQEHRGEADTLSDLEGPTLLDASLRLVALSRSTLADRQLAYAYRPMLFFDKRELYAWPVDIDAAFSEGIASMCKHAISGEKCDEVKRASGLDQSFDYLRFDAQRFTLQDRAQSPQTVGSTYYYRVIRGKPGSNTYIDYWWFLPYNPSLSAWMCSPGFGVPDFDCFDHESDWEGVTVEVKQEGDPPPLVYYAQHAQVARHSWHELKDGWRGLKRGKLVDAAGAHHPLVFVARASHASYRNPCSDPACFEYGSVLPEGKHDGEGEWSGDDDEVCAGVCLKPLPITRAGRPATWNAFSGPWGTQKCILGGTFCDRGEAPHSPSFQWRYTHPGVVR